VKNDDCGMLEIVLSLMSKYVIDITGKGRLTVANDEGRLCLYLQIDKTLCMEDDYALLNFCKCSLFTLKTK
jgi:hypothetical protein